MLLGSLVWATDYNVNDFGATPDGLTLNTIAIQSAIDYAGEHGGGRVVVGPGRYVVGSIYMKSHVELHLETGAVLLGSLNPWDYIRDPYSNWTALVHAVKQNNISITGGGTIDGRGFQVATRIVDYARSGLCDIPLRFDRPAEGYRPENIHFRECNHVIIKDITLKNPACWTQQYDQCTDLLLDGVKVDAKCYWNNDGLDVVDCQHVVVRNCNIDSSDDAYCFKSHSIYGLSEDVLMENCVGRSSANGIKFGTMTLGLFRNFTFRNNIIYDTYRSAITIASVDGGRVEHVVVDGLKSIHTGNPFFIRVGTRRMQDTIPCVKDVVLKNIYAEVPFDKPDAGYNYEGPVEDLPRNVCPSSIIGIPGYHVQDVYLENIEIVYPGKADSTYAYCGHTDAELKAIPEIEKSYPEFSNWLELPAWALYMRHADNITMKNVVFRVLDKDYRPAIVADDVTEFTHDNLTVEQEGCPAKNQIIWNQAKTKSKKNRKK